MAASSTSKGTTLDTSASLYDRIATSLPAGCAFTLHHISTPPTKCEPLFEAPPGHRRERTYCESQFLTVSVQPRGSIDVDRVLAFAVELLIYTTRRLTTIFVSKADSTGYLTALALPRSSSSSPVRTVTSTFISWLVERRQRPGVRLVVSLFARAQSQYLFPGSAENAAKHVLDDRQLVKWWCRTLDPVMRHAHAPVQDDVQGYVIVPGLDKRDTTPFFPPTHQADLQRWQHGHPLRELSYTPTAPPRCLVPRFPDDPKARYLDDLDQELPDATGPQIMNSPTKRGSGVWKSIKTLEQFWEMMACRQECSSGRLVGFIWLVFTPLDFDQAALDDVGDSQLSTSPLPSASSSQELPLISNVPSSPTKSRRRTKLTGLIVPRQPRIKSSSSTLSTSSQGDKSAFWKWPVTSRGQVLLDESAYTRVHDLLLKLDFATEAAATRSTKKWIDEVAVMAGSSHGWGRPVTGRKQHSGQVDAGPADGCSVKPINDMSGLLVRKKRKVDDDRNGTSGASAVPSPVPAVNVLGGNMVRKKPKIS